MTRARDLASLGDNTSKLEQQGLVQVIASSVTKGASGSASVDSKGNVTFSGTESISLNGVFSSTYENYRIVLTEVVFSSGSIVDASMRLRSSGSDASGSNYIRQMQRVYGAGTQAPEGGTSTAWYLGSQSTGGNDGFYTFDMANPFLSKSTSILFNVHNYQSDIATYIYKSGGGVHNVISSYDGFSFGPGSGTITGTIQVYGYKK